MKHHGIGHLKRVCVFCGSSSGGRPSYGTAAEALGRALATRGIGLVYGGARVGLMGALADATVAAGGEVIGVIPTALVAKEVAHDGLTDLRVVSSMHERKSTMADLSDGFIALPGGWGTLEEFFEVLTWGQLGLHRKPCGLLNAERYFDGLLAFCGHMMEEGFVRREQDETILMSTDPTALIDMLATYTPRLVEQWIDKAAT